MIIGLRVLVLFLGAFFLSLPSAAGQYWGFQLNPPQTDRDLARGVSPIVGFVISDSPQGALRRLSDAEVLRLRTGNKRLGEQRKATQPIPSGDSFHLEMTKKAYGIFTQELIVAHRRSEGENQALMSEILFYDPLGHFTDLNSGVAVGIYESSRRLLSHLTLENRMASVAMVMKLLQKTCKDNDGDFEWNRTPNSTGRIAESLGRDMYKDPLLFSSTLALLNEQKNAQHQLFVQCDKITLPEPIDHYQFQLPEPHPRGEYLETFGDR